MTDEDIQKTTQDPSKASLDDKDRGMVVFVMNAIKKPNDVTQTDVDGLRSLGWTDNDILDAMSHAASMVSASILMKTFKMDIAC